VPVLLPFRARYAPADTIYIPGEEPPEIIDSARLSELQEPALFLYRQQFGASVRYGVMGLLNRDEATVFPHEETSPERVAACAESIAGGRTDPGSLWLWCRDEAETIGPLLHTPVPAHHQGVDRFGVAHCFRAVSDPAEMCRIQRALQGKSFFLADGHHRFAAGWNLATIQIRNSTLRSLAAHRRISRSGNLRLPALHPVADLAAFQRATPPGFARFGVAVDGRPLHGFEIRCGYGESKLAALRRQVIGDMQVDAVRDLAQAPEGQTILLVEPVEIDAIEDDAQRGILLPPKSTDFYPKLAAGVVIKG
jgi:hypothetical protein